MPTALFRLLRLPLDLLAVATPAKSFRDNAVLGSRLLNRLGLHVLRVILAHALMRGRRALLAWRLDTADRAAFARDGFLIKTDFLPPALFAALEREAATLADAGRAATQGDTVTRQLLLDHQVLQSLPALRAALAQPAHRRLLGYVAGRLRVPLHFLQTIDSGAVAGDADPQRRLHSDTFQPTMKAWLFITDADTRNGPFTYVPGSHRLTLARLRWEYRQSLRGAALPELFAARGSLRIDAAELPALQLPPPRALVCARNTLVVADTRGFHCRGAADGPARRVEIWSLARTQPFNALPGLPFATLDRVDVWLYRRFELLRGRWRKRVRGSR